MRPTEACAELGRCDAAMSWEERDEHSLSLDHNSNRDEAREDGDSPTRLPSILYRVRQRYHNITSLPSFSLPFLRSLTHLSKPDRLTHKERSPEHCHR